jgi:hypothetical protein
MKLNNIKDVTFTIGFQKSNLVPFSPEGLHKPFLFEVEVLRTFLEAETVL